VERRGVVVYRRFVYVGNKFCLKCSNFSVQFDGLLMIYCVESEQYSAYFDWELFSNFYIFGVQH